MRTLLTSEKDDFLLGNQAKFPKGLKGKYQTALAILQNTGRYQFIGGITHPVRITMSSDFMPECWEDVRRQHFSFYEHLGIGGNLAEVFRKEMNPEGQFSYLLDGNFCDAAKIEEIINKTQSQETAIDMGIVRLEASDVSLQVVPCRQFELASLS